MFAKVNNAFVMSATIEQLIELAAFVGMSRGKIKHAAERDTLRAQVGTRFTNSAEHGAAFSNGGIDIDMATFTQPEPPKQPEPAPEPEVKADTRKHVISAKDWLRALLSDPAASFTLDELCFLSGKSAVNIRTMLSDLRSSKYCGNGGVFATKSTRVNGKVYYSRA